MSFAMPTGMRAFFATITDRGSAATRWIMFDSYYACALLGLHARRLGPDASAGDVFLQSYPDDYKAQADHMAGLLIDAELDRGRIDLANKASVEAKMIQLLLPGSGTGLSDVGVGLLNRYAVGGFERLEAAMDPPARLEDLLVGYAELWSGMDEGSSEAQ
jgi:hypothetical protein